MTQHNTGDLFFLNAAFIGVEVAKYQELVNWGLTACCSITLLAINLLRIYKLLKNPQAKSGKRKEP